MSVLWTRGTRMIDGKMQLGVAVLRPGWFAFLPLFAPVGAGDQFSMGMTGTFNNGIFRMDVVWQGKYPMQQWWQGGEKYFDDCVMRAAHEQGGFVLGRADGEVVRTKHATTFQTAQLPPVGVTIAHPPPPQLLEGWAPGVAHFDAKAVTKVGLILTVVCVLLAGGCVGSAAVANEWPVASGAILWLGLLAFTWIMFAKRRGDYERGMRAKQAARNQAPYR